MEIDLLTLSSLSSASALASLALAAFLAATLLPASSEVVLIGLLKLHPELQWPAIIVATLANTAGGMTTYWLGRAAAAKKPLKQLDIAARYGPKAMLGAWLPFVGDGLVLAAGWLRLDWRSVLSYQMLGRFARYVVIAWGVSGVL